MLDSLGIKQTQNLGSYLRLLSSIGINKISLFSYVEDKTRLKVQGWKDKLLFPPSQEVLFKFVVATIPTYAMSCILLSKMICKSINYI